MAVLTTDHGPLTTAVNTRVVFGRSSVVLASIMI